MKEMATNLLSEVSAMGTLGLIGAFAMSLCLCVLFALTFRLVEKLTGAKITLKNSLFIVIATLLIWAAGIAIVDGIDGLVPLFFGAVFTIFGAMYMKKKNIMPATLLATFATIAFIVY